MPTAIARAIGQLFDPRILGLVGLSALLSLGCFAAAWCGIDWLLASSLGEFVASSWLRLLGGVATLALAWFLFPLVTSVFVVLFLERTARIVEARHYPDLPPAPGVPWLLALGCSLRFLAAMLAANALLLLLLFSPVAYPFGYFLLNGWLLGREYFEFVALRRHSPAAAKAIRDRRGGELLLTGVALTFLLTLPVVNLVVPILATATFVHRYEDWRRRSTAQAGGG